MKTFLKKIFLFIVPIFMIGLVLSPLIKGILTSGEFGDIDKKIISQRENHNILLGMGFNEDNKYYKLSNANYYEADVIALGTSRVMQFQGKYIDNFYNCGGAVFGNYYEYTNFLKNLTYKPKIVVVGLDSWVFNDNWNKACEDYSSYREITKSVRGNGTILKPIIQSWLKNDWKLHDLSNYEYNIGFNARIRNDGFRYDGSYYYGERYRTPEKMRDYKFSDTLQRIENGNNRFEWGDNVDQDTIIQLEDFLKYCSDNDIYVVGIIPPFAPSVYNKIVESGNYQYMESIEPYSKPLFEKYNYCLFNYADGTIGNCTDEYYVDGFHGGDVVYELIAKDIALNVPYLQEYINISKIDYYIDNSYDTVTNTNPFISIEN